MAKPASKRTAWLVHGLTIAALALVFAVYYLVYIPSKTAVVTERNFRLLADMGDQIKEALGSLDVSLLSAAKFLAQNPPDVGADPMESFTDNVAQIEPPIQFVAFPSAQRGGAFACKVITVEHDLTHYWLQLDYSNALGCNGFSVKTDLAELLRPIVSRYDFGEILLVSTNGRVLFQKSQAESRASNPNSSPDLLLRSLPVFDREQGTNALYEISSLSEIPLRGDKYKVFSQPLPLALGLNPQSNLSWVVCGLTRTEDFNRETWQVSPTLAVIFLFLAGAVLLSWPWFNVLFISPSAELRRANILWLLASSFFICSSLTGVLLYADAYLSAERELDDESAGLASAVRNHLTNELAQASTLLTELDGELGQEARNAAECGSNVWSRVRLRTGIFGRVPELLSTFTDACWIDSNGVQAVKWVPRTQPPELLPVGDRPYFRSLREQWAWPCRAFDLSSTNSFYLEPIFSRTRNENTAVYSSLFSPTVGWPTNQMQTNGYILRPLVSTLIFQPLSLFNPVLPAGSGFCVIETSGRVLFHSDSRRNLRENFILETERNTRLKNALQNRIRDDFDCPYLNQPHHLAIEPVPETPWSVVAFRDERLAAAAHRNMVLMASLLFSLYSLGVLLSLVLGPFWRKRALRKHNASRSWFYWLWPSYDWPRYLVHLALAGLATVGCLVAILGSARAESLVLSGLLAPVSFAAARCIASPFKGARKSDGESESTAAGCADLLDKKTRRAHIYSLAVAFILLAMLPSFACYKIAFLKEGESFVKSIQLQLARELQQRPVQIRVSAPRHSLGGRSDYWNLVRDIRSTNAWSRYFDTFLDTTVTNLSANDRGSMARERSSLGLLDRLYKACRPSFEEIGPLTGGLVASVAADGSWHSGFEGDRLALTVRGGAYPDVPTIKVSSRFPAAGWISGFSRPPFSAIDWRLGWYLGLGVVAAVPFLLAWLTARRLLSWDLPRGELPTKGIEDLYTLWHECSAEEKATLYQIATHGFVQPGRGEVVDLLKKGLIHFDPELSMDPNFRTYVRDHFSKEPPPPSEDKAGQSSPFDWSAIRGPVGIGITVIAVLLFATQKELWQLVVAFVGTFATLTQQLSTTSWFLGGKKPPS